MADETHSAPDPVWADVWNPEPNTWSPTDEPFPAYGQDAATVLYQSHADVALAEPLSESYGAAPSGTVPEAGMNLLTDVRQPAGPTPPPNIQVIQHEVHTYETGSEAVRFHQETVQGIAPTTLLMQNPMRKRALLKIVAAGNTTTAVQNTSASNIQETFTVPPGQTWSGISSFLFTYVTDATVGNRDLQIIVRSPAPGNLVLASYQMAVVQAASTVETYITQNGITTDNFNNGFHYWPNIFAGLTLLPGTTIQIVATGTTGVGDSFGSTATLQATVSGGGVFVMMLHDGGNAAAAGEGWQLNPGDPPLEIKSQAGIEAVVAGGTATGGPSAVVTVYEELVLQGALPGLSV